MPGGIAAAVLIFFAGLFPLAQCKSSKLSHLSLQPSGQQELDDPAELEAFLDGVMSAQLEISHILGAAVSVVKDGKLFLAKGYGYADAAKTKPVNPSKTLFRIASVSKLFTCTAVMQLAEQGKVDLNTDVNFYLEDIKIPETYPESITLAHLMTHTAGFKTELKIAGPSAKELVPLRELLVGAMPPRIAPPGRIGAYSNAAISLAGYAVARISGMSWEDYVEEKILKPLEMFQTTTRQPLPAHMVPDLSAGCVYSNGKFEAGEFEYQSHTPAASMSATAADMAHFMMAHLQGGRFKNNRILKEATVQDMHRRHFSRDPKSNGMAYGFFVMDQNNQHIIGHTGVTRTFHSLLALLPEHGVGLFVSVNTAGGNMANQTLLKLFLDRYFVSS